MDCIFSSCKVKKNKNKVTIDMIKVMHPYPLIGLENYEKIKEE
jgi:hypothetical protein